MKINKKFLYHYTSQEGFFGILNDKNIRATSIFYLNDTVEFNYSIDLFKKYIIEIKDGIEEPPKAGTVGMSIFLGPRTENEARNEIKLSFLNDLLTLIDIFGKFHIFVCSFSEEPDLLSQWRGYCPHGNGFSLGFETSVLGYIADKNKFSLVSCIYEIDEQKNLIKQLIDKYMEKFPTMITVEKKDHLFSARAVDDGYKVLEYGCIDEFINKLAPRLKHAKFKEEKEWRLISSLQVINDIVPNKLVNYRKGTSIIVPYMNIELIDQEGEFPLDRLYIGPTSHEKLSEISAKGLLSSKSIHGCVVIPSEIPYRVW